MAHPAAPQSLLAYWLRSWSISIFVRITIKTGLRPVLGVLPEIADYLYRSALIHQEFVKIVDTATKRIFWINGPVVAIIAEFKQFAKRGR
jgi:hypothetical protein